MERRSEGSAVVPNQSVEPRVIPKRTEGLFRISGNGAAQARASGSHGAIALVSGLKQRMTGKRFVLGRGVGEPRSWSVTARDRR